MSLSPYSLLQSALLKLNPEKAHDLSIDLLARTQRTPLDCFYRQPFIQDPITLAGIHFPNRVGLAAGLDKNGRVVDAFAAMGFGFIEAGTVTPQPQAGNPKPRLFRLPKAQALINRFGFNNNGLDVFINHIKKSTLQSAGQVLGLNIGKNATTPIEKAADDYLLALQKVYAYADYVTINISSPNTKNLRTLQTDAALEALLKAIDTKRQALTQQQGKRVPLFVKIAPDLDELQIQSIARTLVQHNMDGVIATNTTLSRQAVQDQAHSNEAGGLSGAPLLNDSNRVIELLRKNLDSLWGPGYPIIGVGGVLSAPDAISKIEAGANLVQIYTGLIYKGSQLIPKVAQALSLHCNVKT